MPGLAAIPRPPDVEVVDRTTAQLDDPVEVGNPVDDRPAETGVTENPVLLTRSVAKGETRVTMGGAPVYVWPGGGITVMADVTRMPKNAFGYVPTPAIVAPMEFTLPRALYERLGGHSADIVSVGDIIRELGLSARIEGWQGDNPWPFGEDKP